MAWIVYPSTSNAKTPVVVVVHEIFGLSTWVRGVADQVAADGFIAIAPDLISRVRGGPSTEELSGDSARKLIEGVNIGRAQSGITAVAKLRDVAAVGRAALRGDRLLLGREHGVDARRQRRHDGLLGRRRVLRHCPYMNGAVPIADSLAKITKPVMLLSGSKDARIGAAMPAIDSTMKALGKTTRARTTRARFTASCARRTIRRRTRDEAEEAGEPRGDEGRVAEDGRVPEEESRREV